MKNKLFLLLFLLTSVILYTGCSKSDDSTSPTNGNTTPPTANASGQPIPNFTGEIAGVLSTIQFDFDVPSPVPIPPVTYKMGFASFNNNEVGSVKINTTSLTKMQQGTVLYYSSFSQTNPSDLSTVTFNGSSHNWDVTGMGNTPSFTGSVTSPTSFTLSSPTLNATIQKSDGLRLQWTGTSAADSVLIQAVATNGSGYVLKQNVSNTGTYTFSAADLGNINGTTLVQIVKYRYAFKTVSSKTFVLVSEIVKSVTVNIN